MHSNSAFLIAGTCSYAHEQRYVPGTELVNESIGMNKLQAQSNEARSSSSNRFWIIFSKCTVRQQWINYISIGMKNNGCNLVKCTEQRYIAYFWSADFVSKESTAMKRDAFQVNSLLGNQLEYWNMCSKCRVRQQGINCISETLLS